MPLAEADVRVSVHACKGEQRVRSAIVKQIFFGSAGALPSRKFAALPFASRYSQIAAVSARQEPRPPILSTD
jgi:hypothetical protein